MGITSGLEALKPLEEAQDMYEALGIWWARVLLSHRFDINSGDEHATDKIRNNRATIESSRRDFALERRPQLEASIGAFAQALTNITRDRKISQIFVDYEPDDVLLEAAFKAGMTDELSEYEVLRSFPIKTSSSYYLGVMRGKVGETGAVQQIWPPAEASNA